LASSSVTGNKEDDDKMAMTFKQKIYF